MPPPRTTSAVTRAFRDGAILAGLLFAGYLFLVVAPAAGTFGFDAFAYWSVDLDDPYGQTAGGFGAFTYSPAIARLFAPFSVLAWWQFLVLWLALQVASAVWLGGRWVLAALAFPPVALELYHGNIHLLMAVAIAVGFRWPAAWAFVLLTKVTPGVGLLWFLIRREWRSLAIALAFTAAIALVSFAIDGPIWRSWVADSLLPTGQGRPLGQPHIAVPLLVRIPFAAAIVTWGALTNRRWSVPLAAAVALPVLWLAGFAILAAIPALTRPELGGGAAEPARAGASLLRDRELLDAPRDAR